MPLWHHVPGETPIDDLSGLKVKGIALRKELNEYEAENIRKAVVKYFAAPPTAKMAPFDLSWALRLHREMFGDVWKWAGVPRTTDLNIGVAWYHVETRLHQLLENLKYWTDLSLLEQAAMLHHKAVEIHPFLNGNGRWARMLASIWLTLNGSPPTRWPESTVGEESPIRSEYLAAIRAADAGEYGPLVELHRRYTPSLPVSEELNYP
jgi:Fic-DOC domain mobile mystery protein B